VKIVGAGDATVLQGATSPVVHLVRSDLSSVAVRVQPTSGSIGITANVSSEIDHVTVTSTGDQTTGVNIAGGSLLRDSAITMQGTGGYAIWASAYNGEAPTIQDMQLDAYTSLLAYANGEDAPVLMQRVTARNGRSDVLLNGGRATLRDVVLRHVAGGQAAFSAEANFGHGASLVLDHATVLGYGGGTALSAYDATAGTETKIIVSNSTLRGFGSLTSRTAQNGATANIQLAYSDAHPSLGPDSGPGAVTLGPGMMDLAEPGFVSAADPHLVAGSALIDAGAPGAPGSATDRDGNPRPAGGGFGIGGGGGGAAAAPAAEPAPAPDDAPSSGPAPVAPAVPSRAIDVRALLRQAIANAKGRRYAFAWPQAGTVRFSWVRHGRTIAAGRVTRSAPGVATVTLKGAKRLPQGARVRASFTPRGGAPVRVSVRAPRR
jgi:hypothetical protein